MNCPKCENIATTKAGIVFGRQRYLCKVCNYHYTVIRRKNVATVEQKQQALNLYLEGLGFRSIGRILKVSHVAVYNWIKEFGSQVKDVDVESSIAVTELDEMHTYIKTKKTIAGSGLQSTEKLESL